MKAESGRKKLIVATWSLAASLLILLFIVYVLLFMSKGWFSLGVRVESQGNNINVIDLPVIVTVNGSADAVIENVSINYTDIDGLKKITPGSSGYIELDLTYSGIEEGEHIIGINTDRIYSRKPTDEQTTPEPVEVGTEINDISHECDAFFKSHIALFSGYNQGSGLYEGWITNGYKQSVTVERDADGVLRTNGIRIYWVWFASAQQFLDSTDSTDSHFIHYTNSANHAEWLDGFNISESSWLDASETGAETNSAIEYAYDQADTIIGSSFNDIIVKFTVELEIFGGSEQ